MTNTDFDFLTGSWDSRQRRLTKVLAGNDEWYEFDATLDCQVLLDGNGVFDVLRAPERDIEGSPSGCTARTRRSGASGGPPSPAAASSTCRWSGASRTGWASSSATTSGRARGSASGTAGPM
ncbi:hypothetical protein ACFQ1L_29410 [Phytohabitans flavus]|uniref:hypothetical protein n=1 Tax=Phytohabitans flavus TaxID=1076124 RepID=UPI003632B03A